MDKHSTCPFCGNNRKSFLVDNGYDVSAMYFYEDEDFSISPDLSPLVTGHLLVIPTKHYASFGEIEDISMLSRIRSVAEQLLGTKDLLIFEHGAVIEGEGGASVDHAHMHIMPRPTNMTVTLIDEYVRESGCVSSTKIMAPHEVLHSFFLERQPYIFYEIENQRFAYPAHTLPHQFLRMMLQPYCQLSYNWRITYSTEECRRNVNKTIDYIKDRLYNLLIISYPFLCGQSERAFHHLTWHKIGFSPVVNVIDGCALKHVFNVHGI